MPGFRLRARRRQNQLSGGPEVVANPATARRDRRGSLMITSFVQVFDAITANEGGAVRDYISEHPELVNART
jgi:hypothetical protein